MRRLDSEKYRYMLIDSRYKSGLIYENDYTPYFALGAVIAERLSDVQMR